MSLSPEEKRRFLKALEEDEEFRLAVASLLGFGSILEELKRLREDFNKFVQMEEERWKENNKRWEENNKRWEQYISELRSLREEYVKLREDFNKFIQIEEERWRDNEKRWEENNKRWEENNRRWEQYIAELKSLREEHIKLREDFNRFVRLEEERWRIANKRFSRIEMELGALAESQYSRYAWEDLRDELRARGENVLQRLRNARVDNVDIDLLVITDKAAYVVEVKVKPTRRDVKALLGKAEVVRGRFGKPVIPVLTGSLIGVDVESYALNNGVKVYRY